MSRRGLLFQARPRTARRVASVEIPTTGPLRRIRFYSRTGFSGRWLNAAIEGSNDGTSWTLIATVPTIPPEGAYYQLDFASSTAYYRYRCRTTTSEYLDAAELEFWTESAQMTAVSIFGTPGFEGLALYALSNAFDGNTSTFWASEQAAVGTAHIGIVVS